MMALIALVLGASVVGLGLAAAVCVGFLRWAEAAWRQKASEHPPMPGPQQPTPA